MTILDDLSPFLGRRITSITRLTPDAWPTAHQSMLQISFEGGGGPPLMLMAPAALVSAWSPPVVFPNSYVENRIAVSMIDLLAALVR